MSVNVHKYRIYCTVHGSIEFYHEEPGPTACNIDATDEVNLNSVHNVSTPNTNQSKVVEEDIPTGGHFKTWTESMTATAGESKILDVSYLYPINVLSTRIVTGEDHRGSTISLIVGPNTTIGQPTVDVAQGNNVIDADATSLEYAALGYKINLYNFISTEIQEMGEIIEIDVVAGTITTSLTATSNHTYATSAIQISVYMMDKFEFGEPWGRHMGDSKIGSSYIPAGTIIRMVFQNNHESKTLTLIGENEALY
jgi:hypothetical protein